MMVHVGCGAVVNHHACQPKENSYWFCPRCLLGVGPHWMGGTIIEVAEVTGISKTKTEVTVRCPRHGNLHLTDQEVQEQSETDASGFMCPACIAAGDYEMASYAEEVL